MALRTVSILGGNWSSVTTWVGGVVPVSGDTVDFTALSGNLTVNVTTATLAGINFTNYVSTITFNANIAVNTSVNLGTGGYTQAGGGTFGLVIGSATTITSNGVSWNNLLTFSGNSTTYTLADNLTVTGNIVLAGTSSITFTGNILYIGGNLTSTSLSTTAGTTEFIFNGTGTWSSPGGGAIRTNLKINTITGPLTISGNVYYQTGTLTYIAGTVVTTGSVLNIANTSTLDTSGIAWNTVNMSVGIQTLTSDLNCQNLTISGSSNVTINSSVGNIFILGNLSYNSNGDILGTASINLIGTGTWNHVATGDIKNNLNINTSGTLTISGNVNYNTGTLTYTSGTVITTGSTLNIANTTNLDTNGITWNNVSFTFGTTTLTSDLNCQNLIINCNSTPQINLKNIYVSSNLQIDGTNFTQGTTEIILIGNGTWSNSSNGTLNIDLTINTSGTIKLGTNIHYAIKTLTYINGKVNTKDSTLNLFAPAILINCHKINFDKVIIGIAGIITMNEFFSGSPAIVTNIKSSNTVNNFTIAFQDGFEKITKFVDINNCTLSKPLQLLVITNSPRNSTNRGIRYINQSPNGIAKNKPSINVPLSYGVGGLLSDPNMK
jgi:hypothetical protein